MEYIRPAWKRWLAAVLVSVLAHVPSTLAQPASLQALAAGLVIDERNISVSGVSSGAYMAQQFHVAHSRHVAGAGLIAGGPYRCAAGVYLPYSWFDWTGLYAATSRCSDTNPWWIYQGPPEVAFSISETRREAQRGSIDPLQGLRDDRVWLLSGARDETVPGGVMDTLVLYYRDFMPAGNIRYHKLEDAGHAMITTDFGNACEVSATPFLSDCDFDAAGELLAHLHGPLAAPAAGASLPAVAEFDQRPFFDPGEPAVSLHVSGHLYLPASCAAGERCRLHVAFHGCQQSQDLIGDAFYGNAGYNEWAQTNHTVVLYPQATAWSGGVLSAAGNPNGCWDWWGYSGEDYHTRDGPQIAAVAAMIDTLLGHAALSTAR